MPCDSAAAGLIGLGVMRRRLETEGANDLTAHFERIRSLAARPTKDFRVFDQRERGRRAGPYVPDGRFSDGLIWVRLLAQSETRVTISLGSARFWKFADEPALEILHGQGLPYVDFYAAIAGPDGTIRPQNLNHTDSEICLAGRSSGDAGTYRAMAEIRFRVRSGLVASLAELLTIHEWHGQTVSRVVFFNSRTGNCDRTCRPSRLVVADGALSFLMALQKFPASDVVGVLSRDADREKLDMIGQKMAELSQWFDGDAELAIQLPSVPRGIAVSVFKGR